MTSATELRDYLDAAREAARRAAVVLDEWRQRFQVRSKGRFDLVTDADLASQRAIQGYLTARFPEHAFLGEEEGSQVRPGPHAPPTWIIDPIDGNERTLDWWRHLSFTTQSLRRTGSTALNLAYTAAGRFDAYWAFDNHVWDVAGATVILREAGGTITNVDGTPYDPYTADALASNGPLHPLLVETFQRGVPSS